LEPTQIITMSSYCRSARPCSSLTSGPCSRPAAPTSQLLHQPPASPGAPTDFLAPGGFRLPHQLPPLPTMCPHSLPFSQRPPADHTPHQVPPPPCALTSIPHAACPTRLSSQGRGSRTWSFELDRRSSSDGAVITAVPVRLRTHSPLFSPTCTPTSHPHAAYRVEALAPGPSSSIAAPLQMKAWSPAYLSACSPPPYPPSPT
jgi:hypothetical protein